MSSAIGIKPGAAWPDWARRNWAWLVVGVTILFVIFVRVRLRDMPLERDEGEYAYAGQLLLHGVPPYKEAYNLKLPGTYAAYAVIMAVLGQTSSGLHLGVALVNAASIILVFLLGRKLLDELTGVVAAVCFGLMSLSPSVLGLAGHATHFVTLFALAGTLVLLKGSEGGSWKLEVGSSRKVGRGAQRDLLLSGLMFGLAFVMKQHGIFFASFGVAYLLLRRLQEFRQTRAELLRPWLKKRPVTVGRQELVRKSTFRAQAGGLPVAVHATASSAHRNVCASEAADGSVGMAEGRLGTQEGSVGVAKPFRPAAQVTPETPKREALPVFPWKRTFQELAILCAGIALPYLLTCLWLWWAGVFHQFVFWTITYALQYASMVESSSRDELLRFNMGLVLGPNLGLWLLAIFGALMIWWEERLDTGNKMLLAALLICSVASVVPGFYFRRHYFITLLPVLALFCGLAVSRSVHLVRREPSIEMFLAVALLFLAFASVGGSVVGNAWYWFTATPDEVTQSEYGTSLFSDARKAADYIREHTSKEARIAVLGSEPEICFYSNRKSVTGYLYAYPLLEQQPYALKMQREMESQIEQGAPEYVVCIDHPDSLSGIKASEPEMFNWWMRYWNTNLDLVATTSIGTGPVHRDEQDDTAEPTTQVSGSLLILKRK